MPHRRASSAPAESHRSGVQAVIFDMGGVLMPQPTTIWQGFEAQFGLSERSILGALLSEHNYAAFKRLESGHITLPDFLAGFVKPNDSHGWHYLCRTGALASALSLRSTYGAAPIGAMMEAVSCIRAEGIRCALLTNNWFVDAHRTESVLVVDPNMFDVVVESCRVGMRKPDPAIYEHTLSLLRCPADRAVFLDDIGENLKPARQLGIHTIKVTDTAAALAALERTIQVPLRGYVPGTTAVRPGFEISLRNLISYAKAAMPIRVEGEEIALRQFSHGQSNPTYLWKVGPKKFVLRKKPPGKLLSKAHMIEREFRVMKAIRPFGVPLPEPIHLCEDPSILGTPFYVMGFGSGSVYTDPRLPEKSPSQRARVYAGLVDVLARIHRIDLEAAGLANFGPKGNYLERNMQRWMRQYEQSKTEEITAIDDLARWLRANMPPANEQRTTLVHGDFRLDNVLYDHETLNITAVLDWEISTLGDPLTDLATCLFAHYTPDDFQLLAGMRDVNVSELGIPTAEQFVSDYCRLVAIPQISPRAWAFYVAFVAFRYSAIIQGVYKRALLGQASAGEVARGFGKLPGQLARIGMDTVSRFEAQYSAPHRQTAVAQPTAGADVAFGHFAAVPRSLLPRALSYYKEVKQVVEERIVPKERELMAHATDTATAWTVNPQMEKWKGDARAAGLWNLFVPASLDPAGEYGPRLSNVEYAHICEVMGRCLFAPEVFNCSAPDTGNMEVLIKYGTDEQKRRWLKPLLDGDIRSCFAMTEPDVASSDATNMRCTIVRDGDGYVVNGSKWFVSGAADPRCALAIVMGRSADGDGGGDAVPKHKRHSMILVPMDAPGVQVGRAMHVIGMHDAPAGHCEMRFADVRVPLGNMILAEGEGFAVAQGRLGPGRIHHCMRLIGHCERALDLMKQRVQSRTAFGRTLSEMGSVREDIARSRIEIEQARLLVLKTAHMIDVLGAKGASQEISLIKADVPSMAMRVIDRAMQAHGAMGVSQDTPLAAMYAWARALRLADGPDQVHLEAIAKRELRSRL